LGASGGVHAVRARRSKGPLALLLILAVAAVLSGAAWLVAAGPLSKTTTPSLVGLTRAEAAATAQKSGLSTHVQGYRFSEVAPVGEVVATDPSRGDKVDKNGTVQLFLSKGPERYAVPSVVGRTEDFARNTIEDNHLTVGTAERRYSSKVAEGSVIATKPAPGTELKRDQVVVLVISDGPQPVAVPNVVGAPVDQAKAAVIDAGLEPQVREKFNETVPAGTVISQSPEGSTTAGKGSVLKLVVSKGPPLVDVPDVKGKNVTEAQALITAAGLVPSVQQLPGGPGTVLNQNPGGGDRQPKGSTVTLYVF
jgi:serine/threonine-protein kinase